MHAADPHVHTKRAVPFSGADAPLTVRTARRQGRLPPTTGTGQRPLQRQQQQRQEQQQRKKTRLKKANQAACPSCQSRQATPRKRARVSIVQGVARALTLRNCHVPYRLMEGRGEPTGQRGTRRCTRTESSSPPLPPPRNGRTSNTRL